MITCNKCSIGKSQSNYFKYRKRTCKDCVREYDRERYKTPGRKNYLKSHHKKYMLDPKNRKRHYLISAKYAIQWQKNNKYEVRAQARFKAYITNGTIKRPTNCSYCNKKDKIEAHHEDYLKWACVVWLCRSCHKRHHLNKIDIFSRSKSIEYLPKLNPYPKYRY